MASKKSPRGLSGKEATPVRAGVFTTNRARPIHRWYPFVEGYSSELVSWGLRLSGFDRPKILDPFGGSGTTALASAELGLDSWYCEVNPFLAWLADVKVNKTQEITEASQLEPISFLLKSLSGKTQKVTRHSGFGDAFLAIDSKRNYFPEGVASSIVATLEWINNETEGAVRELCRAAVAVSLLPCSTMIRRTDLRRRTAQDPTPISFNQALSQSLTAVLEDVDPRNRSWAARTTQLAGDMRSVQPPHGTSFDLVITSPPYLNGTNYCRNTKLELFALGFLSSEADLSNFRSKSITAGINNVSSRRNDPSEIDAVEEVARKLDVVAYDRRIPALVRLYFSDMREGLQALRSVVRPGADLLLDIGDSRFAGVHVPTHHLLSEVGAQVGWVLIETIPVRERRSFDGSKLTQVVLRFKTCD